MINMHYLSNLTKDVVIIISNRYLLIITKFMELTEAYILL